MLCCSRTPSVAHGAQSRRGGAEESSIAVSGPRTTCAARTCLPSRAARLCSSRLTASSVAASAPPGRGACARHRRCTTHASAAGASAAS